MKLFGNKIEPSCCYCEVGKETADKQMVLCQKCGIVAPYYSCKHFKYAPLKRIPRKTGVLPKFTKDDFAL